MEDIEKIVKILKEKFLYIPVEISLISQGLSIREVLQISDIRAKGKVLDLVTKGSSCISIEVQSIDVWHYYGPGSLVFVMSCGATLTLRPQL